MGVKLNEPTEKPGVSPEALLRALGVNQPAIGLDWEALARLVVIGADYSKGVAEPACPEATWGSNALGGIGPHGANTWSGWFMQAGPRGVWFAHYTTGGGNPTLFKLDEVPSWWVGDAFAPDPDTTVSGWTNDLARVDSGHITNAAPTGGQPGVRINNTASATVATLSTAWVWVPPGACAFIIATNQNTAITNEGIATRAPLASP